MRGCGRGCLCEFYFLLRDAYEGEGLTVRVWAAPENATNCMQVVCMLSRVLLFVTLWTVTHQAPLSAGFPRQEYWSGLPFSPLGDLPNPGFKPKSPALQADSLLPSHRGRQQHK